jgi:hypothetical protein
LSFFDDDEEETAQRPAGRTPRAPQRPSPRRPQRAAGSLPLDQHTLMVRRRVAAGVGVVLLIVIILLINGCLKGQKTDALKTYNHEVSLLAQDQLRVQAQDLAARVKKLSTPGELTDAQRNLLLAFNLRSEAVAKIAALTPTALGGQGKQAITQIAGDNEIFLASDVLYSQRVAPLIQEELKEAGVEGLTTAPSRSLPNIGWLEPTTVESRITGKSAGAATENTSGTHGSALTGVSVGANTLAAEPTLNHVSGGSNPTFTVNVENGGESAETNVKVNVTVTAGGKQFKASHSIEKAEPGKTVSVDIPVNGVPLGEAAKVQVEVEKVPGETNTENNKGTFLAVFAK